MKGVNENGFKKSNVVGIRWRGSSGDQTDDRRGASAEYAVGYGAGRAYGKFGYDGGFPDGYAA